jgi:hypothetical protein
MAVLMTAQDEVHMRRAQGAVMAVQQLVDDYESAPDSLNKLQK